MHANFLGVLLLLMQGAPAPIAARPPADIQSIFANNYPEAALRAEIEGRVEFSVAISAEGSVVGCSIDSSSGNAELDAGTCSLMMRLVRFTPARNAAGQPVPGRWSSRVNWALPAKTKPAPAPATSDMVRSEDPQTLMKALQKANFSASLGKDPYGDPVITVSSAGILYWIIFDHCTDHRKCSSVIFHFAADIDPENFYRLEDWSKSNWPGRVYIDARNHPALDMNVDLSGDGMGQGDFHHILEQWAGALAEFTRRIGWRITADDREADSKPASTASTMPRQVAATVNPH